MKLESMNQYMVSSLRSLVIAGVMSIASSANVGAQTAPDPAASQLTRTEVVHELEELEAVGYNPSDGDDVTYPVKIQIAEAKVAAKHRMEKDAAMSAGQSQPLMPTH
jgi:Domain of unknown function (DUF4148)